MGIREKIAQWRVKISAVTLTVVLAFLALWKTDALEIVTDYIKDSGKSAIYSLNNWANPDWVVTSDRYLNSAYVSLPFLNETYCLDFVQRWGSNAGLEVVRTQFVHTESITLFRKGTYHVEARCVSPTEHGLSLVVLYAVDSNAEIREVFISLENEVLAQLGTLPKLHESQSKHWAIPDRASDAQEITFRIPESDLADISDKGLPRAIVDYFEKKGFIQHSCGKLSCSFSKPAVSVLLFLRSVESVSGETAPNIHGLLVVTVEKYKGVWSGPNSVSGDLLKSMPYLRTRHRIGNDY